MAALLKNLYNQDYSYLLATTVKKHYTAFNTSYFIASIHDTDWETKALKQRMRHIATTLGKFLPQKYTEAIDILKKTFSDMNYAYGLENMIFQDFVAIYGLDDFQTSMDALLHFTVHSSSEFAVRKFIIKYPKQTMHIMQLWAKSDNEHHRRLASEGCRPRLPWATTLQMFQKDPTPVLEVLNILKNDPSKYVQKSVANNLNDISKDHPQLLITLAKQWIHQTKIQDWILKHACRTLLKNSHPEVLEIFGFHHPQSLHIAHLHVPKRIQMGENLTFSFQLQSSKNLGKLRVEFALLFLRKNNKHNKKVFKITEGEYRVNKKAFQKTYSFQKISTRTYYKGEHSLQIIVNGVILSQSTFLLT